MVVETVEVSTSIIGVEESERQGTGALKAG